MIAESSKFQCIIIDVWFLVQVVTTGIYNPASLGIEHIRPLTMARGSREGINAFNPIQHSLVFPDVTDVVGYAVKRGCGINFIKFLVCITTFYLSYS